MTSSCYYTFSHIHVFIRKYSQHLTYVVWSKSGGTFSGPPNVKHAMLSHLRVHAAVFHARTCARLQLFLNQLMGHSVYSCHDAQLPMFALQAASDLWQLCMPNIVIASVVFTCLGNAPIISVFRMHA
jgi:hypothetical protein